MMIRYLSKQFSDIDKRLESRQHNKDEDPCPSLNEDAEDSSDGEDDPNRQFKEISFSPKTVSNALNVHGVDQHLDSVLLDDFLADLVWKEYVWTVDKHDIRHFKTGFYQKILDKVGGTLPKKISRELILDCLPTENNFLLRVGHKIQSSSFIKFWKNYDADCSGYLEMRELKKLVKDYSELAGEEFSEDKLKSGMTRLMRNLDTNQDGKIELEELSKMMNVEDNFMKNFVGRKYLSRKDFNKIFSHYDTDETNYLGKTEVMALINDILKHIETSGRNVPIPIIQTTFNQVMKICDVNRSGTVSKAELALLLSCFE